MQSAGPKRTAGKPRRDPQQSIHAAQLPEALLRAATVVQVTGLSSSTINRRVNAGTFPAPVRLGARCTRWKSAEVAEWCRTVGAGVQL